MTKDNASEAGMELPAPPEPHAMRYEWYGSFGVDIPVFSAEQMRDYATKHAQAHNAKLEAQVERMRAALQPFADRNWTKELAAAAYAAIESLKP